MRNILALCILVNVVEGPPPPFVALLMASQFGTRTRCSEKFRGGGASLSFCAPKRIRPVIWTMMLIASIFLLLPLLAGPVGADDGAAVTWLATQLGAQKR